MRIGDSRPLERAVERHDVIGGVTLAAASAGGLLANDAGSAQILRACVMASMLQEV